MRVLINILIVTSVTSFNNIFPSSIIQHKISQRTMNGRKQQANPTTMWVTLAELDLGGDDDVEDFGDKSREFKERTGRPWGVLHCE